MTFLARPLSGAIARLANGYAGVMHGRIPSPERRKSEISKLKDFERAGDLTIVKRVGEDVEQVAEYVSRIYEAELLDKIGIDPSEVGQILDALSEAGIPDEAVTGVSRAGNSAAPLRLLSESWLKVFCFMVVSF